MVLPPVRDTFRAIARTVVPEAGSLDAAGWAELERLVEKTLEPREPAVKRQLSLLIRAIELLPLLRWGRPFTRLADSERTRFLAALENAPALLLRRGFWGVRTLVLLGYYARPEAGAGIGYRADAHGWEARSRP
ncbi:MAG TPA: gluconate 2-dehydrogenase subunit 3 family protein [Thermoanaerobaculia bacterium]|nr:gluconate 2-dehydrogenase subunit 3 family protein [Thermoanaerobaculia bacterium]